MALFFLEESREKNKYKLMINNMLNKIEERKDENRVFLSLPIQEKKLKLKKIKKLMKRLEEYKIKNLVLSENLYYLKNNLYSMNINVLEGKDLFKILIEDIVNYICKNGKTNMSKIEVAFLINNANDVDKEIIMSLAEKVKTLNIVTNNLQDFQELEDYLYNEKGIVIKISNNYKTALQRSNIIVNIDFTEEMVNKFFLPSNCVIVNIKAGIKIKTKKFNGVNINNYNIIVPKTYTIDGYDDKIIYETHIINEEYEMAKKQILEDKIRIKNLVGEKGIINNKEFFKFA